MKQTRLWLIGALGTFLSFGCGDMFFVELEAPEVCNSLADAGFPGLDPTLVDEANARGIPLDGQTRSITYDYSVPLSDVLPAGMPESAVGEVSLLNVSFTMEQGLPDFSFIDQASILLLTPDGTNLPTQTLLAYTQTPETANQKTIVLQGDRFDLFSYLRQGAINLSISLTGRVPTSGWSTTIHACGYVRGRYNYLQGGQ